MTMLGTTPNGDAYTYDEFKRMLSNAGFLRSELRPLVSNFQQMIISYTEEDRAVTVLPDPELSVKKNWAWPVHP